MKNELIVTTAIPLEPAQQEQVQASLKERFSFSQLAFIVDPRILGGVKLTLPDKVIDCTIARKLRQIRSDLTKR